MNALVIALLISIFSVEYLIKERELLNPYMILLPEALSAVAMLMVFARIISGARISLDWRYVVFFVVLIVVMILGFVLQEVPSGAVLAGLRVHLKFLPFFLVPAVYRFTPEQLRAQLLVLLALFAIQTPLALYQRFIEYAHQMNTGDPVRGTVTTSSALSMLLICAVAAVVVAFLRKRLTFWKATALIGWLFLPTTINETKATLLLLPVAFIVPALFMPRGSRPMRRMLPIVAVGAFAGLAFISVYDTLIQNRQGGQSIGDFVGNSSFERYLYSGAADEGANYIGRLDSIEFAMQHLSSDSLRMAFGLGAANTSLSFLSEFDGQYAHYYDRYGVGMTQVTQFLWEIGIVGVLAYLFLYYCVYTDARMVARSNDPFAPIAQAWVTIVAILTFGLIYKGIFQFNEIGYLFWYFSGIVASRAILLRKERRSRVPRAWHASAGLGPAPTRAADALQMKG